MKLTPQEIEHVALLARVRVSPEEIDLFARQLNDILIYMEKLAEVDTTGIEPAPQALDLSNAFREDLVLPSLPVEEALALAPRQGRSSFVVPKVIY